MDQTTTVTKIDPQHLQRPSVPRRIAEARLIRAARAGSPDASEEIVRRYWTEAERTAVLIVRDQHAAEDIAQEALLTLLESLGRFDERRRLGPWLNRIVVNRAIDWTRKHTGPVDQPSDRNATAPAHSITDPELLDALHRLALPDRVAIVMRVVLSYRAVEIAELLGEPAGTTRSRIHRALQQLRTDLSDQEETKHP
jgi:RNA polymerase sigma-70 factor (ECF subfamily)